MKAHTTKKQAPTRDRSNVSIMRTDPFGPVRARDYQLSRKHGHLFGQDGGGDEAAREDWKNTGSFPADRKEQIETARAWCARNWFLMAAGEVERAFLNSQMTLRAASGKKKDHERVKLWHRKHRLAIDRFVREVWEDRRQVDNVVAVWRERSNPARVFTLPAERCQYSDAMLVEKLSINFGWKGADFAGAARKAAAGDLARRYGSGGYVEVGEATGERFRVLTRARAGWGFAEPRLRALHRSLEMEESLQVADNLSAFLCRAVLRHIKIGHEIKIGPAAGKPFWFFTEEIGREHRDFLESRVGIIDYITNFDVEVGYPHPDGKRFDKARYEAVLQRMAHWCGPAGLLLVGSEPASTLMGMFREVAHAEREAVGPYCEEVLTEAFRPPEPIEIIWGDQCFREQRAWLDLVKQAFNSGPGSQTTLLRLAGLDPDVERSNKKMEAELTKAEVLPIYDAAHGPGGALDSGRPAGAADLGERAGG